jgi:hypothetical protein
MILMEKKLTNIAFILVLIGAILIVINGLFIASVGEPIVLSSYPFSYVFVKARNATYPISSLEALNATEAGFWGRIAFGLRGYVEGSFIILWLILAIFNLAFGIALNMKPEKKAFFAPLIILLSLLSIIMGGGFIIGAVFGVVGGAAIFEWPKSFGDTFVGKMVRAAKLDSTFYDIIGKNPKALKTAALTLIVINILSGLGNGLYVYNANIVRTSTSTDIPFRILLLGEVFWNLSVVGTAIFFVGIGIIKWLIFSLILYYVGAKLHGKLVEFDDIARVLAFAYVPVCLQVFMPFVFLRQPLLWFEWPFTIVFLTNLWMFIALVVALRQRLDITSSKALGIAILAGAIYWLINYTFLVPALDVPGIRFTFSPIELTLVLLSVSVVLATLLGAFTRY